MLVAKPLNVQATLRPQHTSVACGLERVGIGGLRCGWVDADLPIQFPVCRHGGYSEFGLEWAGIEFQIDTGRDRSLGERKCAVSAAAGCFKFQN